MSELELLFWLHRSQKGEYSILNKKYTKEEYEVLVPKIIQHMKDMPYIDQMGKSYAYGEFFPSDISPFAYNETAAVDFFPISKEEAILKGYKISGKIAKRRVII